MDAGRKRVPKNVPPPWRDPGGEYTPPQNQRDPPGGNTPLMSPQVFTPLENPHGGAYPHGRGRTPSGGGTPQANKIFEASPRCLRTGT